MAAMRMPLIRLVALASLLLAHAFAAPHVHLRVRKLHHKQASPAVETSVSTTDTALQEPKVVCPATGDPLASVQQPALTTACPTSCSPYDLCLFYPSKSTRKCVTTSTRSCFHGDSCAFQCLENPGHTGGWYITLYTDASVLDDVATQNLRRSDDQSMAVNASLVAGWVSSSDALEGVDFVSITGNEAANNLPELGSQGQFYEDSQSLSSSQVVAFDLPASFFKDVQGVATLRVENVVLPDSSKDIALSFSDLTELLLRNTRLTEFPLQNSALPSVTFMDLSVNNLQEITRAALPPQLEYLNLSVNSIQKVDKGSIPDTLLAVDLSYNQIKSIEVGTFPATLTELYLEYNGLNEIPRDIASMDDLSTLYLDGNKISQVPDRSIPTESMTVLSLKNCSLRSLPSVVISMTELTDLYLSGNDFSIDLDLSTLPEGLERLELDSCNLKRLPTGLDKLEYLDILTLIDNRQAMKMLPILPLTITFLDLSNNSLEVLPVHVRSLDYLEYLSIMMNPLSKLAPGSLPSAAALTQIDMSDATFQTIQNGTLPDTLQFLMITNSSLKEAPEDIRSMRVAEEIEITDSALQSFEVAAGLPQLTLLNLRNNKITRFSGRFPTLATLDLRNNSLVDFNVTSAPYLQTLHLADNNLTAIPPAIFQFPGLLLLNVSGNPIRNYTPSATEFTTLSRMSVVVLDQAMFSSDCEEDDKGHLREYTVCLPDSGAKAKSSGVSTALVLVNVGLAILLCLMLAFMWRRRNLQKRRLEELRSKTESLEKQQKTQDILASSIWADSILLQHRIDEDLVIQGRLLGSGMFGEVWRATYRNEKVALKRLKPTSDKAAIQNFVEEIKVVMKLSHVRVVRFIGVMWTKETDIAMLTEYMAGGDLRAYLDGNPKVIEGWTQRMMKIALYITEAIVYLHSLEPVVIHRDLKSRNVLLNTKMQAKLSDFGSARYKMDDETMTASVGTVRWIAPEVLLGKRYDESVDIYSLGIILSEIDTHQLPFADATDETNEQLSDSIIAGLILSGSLTTSFSESCPSEIRELAERCTSRDPEARPTGLVVAYELRKMLRSASWTSEGGAFRSSSSGAEVVNDVSVRSAAAAPQQQEPDESSSTPKYISV